MWRWSRRTRSASASASTSAPGSPRAPPSAGSSHREGGAARALRHREPAQALAHPRLPRDLPRARRRAALPGARCPSGWGCSSSSWCGPAAAARIAAALAAADPRTPEAELALLADAGAPTARRRGRPAAGEAIGPGVTLADKLRGQHADPAPEGAGVTPALPTARALLRRELGGRGWGTGGERGIRTLETVPRLHTFQACAFDHSATSPARGQNHFSALAASLGRSFLGGARRPSGSAPARS